MLVCNKKRQCQMTNRTPSIFCRLFIFVTVVGGKVVSNSWELRNDMFERFELTK